MTMEGASLITVSEAARLKKTSRQSVRNAAVAGKIKAIVRDGYMMLLDRASVDAWQPCSRAGITIKKFRARERASRFHAGFVPISKQRLPEELPRGRWFSIKPGVWVGLANPDDVDESKLPRGATLVVKTAEVALIRFQKEKKGDSRSSARPQ